jgi:hypothetical protein
LRAPALTVAIALAVVVPAGPAAAQTGPGLLFPEPFRVAHHLIQEDGDGSRFVGEPVVDTYGGSWIVSERPDGSRLIVDLARRELSEVRTDKGVYWTVSFDRFAELQSRLRAAQGLAPETKKETETRKAVAQPAAELVVTEVAAHVGIPGTTRQSAATLADRPGVQRLRVTRKDAPASLLDVWVDPSLRLTPAALGAVASLETTLAGPGAADASGVPAGRSLAAARAHANGAFPVRTVRPLAAPGAQVEDETTRLERLERFPSELAEIPEGLRRVPHPLEAVVRFLEEDAERDAAMAGRKTGQTP